ncbi:MAG: DJ-1/PfpI family protein [Myxococcota bacterium]
MDIAILTYDKMTALDAVGPYEILSRWPDTRLRFVAERAGPVRTDTRALTLVAEASLEEVDEPDLVLVPGGPGDRAVRDRLEVLAWLRHCHERTRFTMSVCTGSLILAAAGLLQGQQATTHWTRMDVLAELGAVPVSERWVRAGRVWTAAGVSAGIDLALALTAEVVGDTFAQALQLGIEYDPAPPFDAGSPARAPGPVVDLVRASMARS